MNRRSVPAVALIVATTVGIASQLGAYPGGTPRIVTNVSPFCSGCHSSVTTDQLRDLPAEAQAGQLPEKKHYAAISAGDGDYQKLQPADREKLLAAVKAMDANSKVSIAVSSTSLKALATLTVTVTTRGGAGPVVGVMLLDTDLRWQSSPVQTEGFVITQPPQVTGPDGKPQTKFLDNRLAELSKNINYVNIGDVKSDPDAGTYPECKVVYTLKAPATPGEYTVTAAFLYGTEKAIALGRVEVPGGRVIPAGGGGAASGRIQFAKPVKITVS